jgi:hypothetical protein
MYSIIVSSWRKFEAWSKILAPTKFDQSTLCVYFQFKFLFILPDDRSASVVHARAHDLIQLRRTTEFPSQNNLGK